jgi:hypothetical protein
MNKRDDFSQKTIDTLCERVGGKCSNPNCRRETKGPHSNPQKRVSIGEEAHITAAAEGGPRYDPDLTPEERSSIENGRLLMTYYIDNILYDKWDKTITPLKKTLHTFAMQYKIEVQGNIETVCLFLKKPFYINVLQIPHF